MKFMLVEVFLEIAYQRKKKCLWYTSHEESDPVKMTVSTFIVEEERLLQLFEKKNTVVYNRLVLLLRCW